MGRIRLCQISETEGVVLDSTQKIKCYEISPAGDSRFDTFTIEAGDSWKDALYQAEQSLEQQFLDEKDWDEIQVTVKCVYRTQEQLDELETE